MVANREDSVLLPCLSVIHENRRYRQRRNTRKLLLFQPTANRRRTSLLGTAGGLGSKAMPFC